MIDAAFGNWLAGFIDGEGCFTVEITNNRRPCLRFSILVRMDDAPIIREIRDRTGIGSLYTRGERMTGGRPQIVWRVQKMRECEQLAAILDVYPLRAKKKRDYAIWRTALDDMLNNRLSPGPRNGRENPRDDAYIERMEAYRESLRAVRAYEADEDAIAAMVRPQLQLIRSASGR